MTKLEEMMEAEEVARERRLERVAELLKDEERLDWILNNYSITREEVDEKMTDEQYIS
jgi:hypothetical protein